MMDLEDILMGATVIFTGLMVIFIILLVLTYFIGLFALDLGVSHGSFRGKVVDVESTGLIWKNDTFHLLRTNNDTVSFTICKDVSDRMQIIEFVENSQQTGKEIIVDYADRFFYWGSQCDPSSTPAFAVRLAG